MRRGTRAAYPGGKASPTLAANSTTIYRVFEGVPGAGRKGAVVPARQRVVECTFPCTVRLAPVRERDSGGCTGPDATPT